MTKLYLKGADAALIVYDVTDKISFEKVTKWLEVLNNENGETLTYIVGNKCD